MTLGLRNEGEVLIMTKKEVLYKSADGVSELDLIYKIKQNRVTVLANLFVVGNSCPFHMLYSYLQPTYA